MKTIYLIIAFCVFAFANSQNITLMNNIKDVVQKEEYISLAINKYIRETGKIPKTTDNVIDWDLLMVNGYLGAGFNKYNPFTKLDIEVVFDSNNTCFIKGVFDDVEKYNANIVYAYNFYINKSFRINTLPPKSVDKDELVKGSQVIYGDIQKKLIKLLGDSVYVRLDGQKCPTNNYYYELKNGELTYKYCKSDYSIDVYQKSPIYLENRDDLQYIKANIGDIAYVKVGGKWFAYFYQGDVSESWRPFGDGSVLTSQDPDLDIEDRLISYIPDAKDLVLRRDGGCMLANGDIFCWGNNKYKKAGIESYGQIDTSLSPDYVNIPVMLKTQILDTTHNTKKWYNSPFRIKFEKMSMNSTNVCGISPIFDYFQSGEFKKFGGDLFCNGQVSSEQYEDLAVDQGQTSILKRNKFFATGKEDQINNANEIYLVDVAMVEDTIAVLSDDGKIYTVGRNYGGALGIDNTDKFFTQLSPVSINDGQYFKKIFALRDIRGFGAVDEHNNFWYWGERVNGTIYYKPTLLASGKKFNPDMIFVNSSDFVLKGMDNIYYRTRDNLDLISLSAIPTTALSVAIYDDGASNQFYLYIDENMQLHGSSSLTNCRLANEVSTCTTTSNTIFDTAFNKLNDTTNTINGKNYASFANIGIYQLDHVITDALDDFEDDLTGWNRQNTHNGGSQATTFLGRWASGSSAIDYVNKTFDFGVSNANQAIVIKLDFYEIDSWDGEYFRVYANGTRLHNKRYWADSSYGNLDNSGVPLVVDGSYGWGDEEKHQITINANLDANGRVRLGFASTLNEGVTNESWGVDNIEIYRASDNMLLARNDFEDEASLWTLKTYSDKNFTNLTNTQVATTTTATETAPDTSILSITQRVEPTRILGRFLIGTQSVERIYDFGVGYANYDTEVEFDFFEIDSWDMERLQVFLNGELVSEDAFIHDAHQLWTDTNDSGVYTLNLGTHYNDGIFYVDGVPYSKHNDQKYRYKLKGKLDSTGKLHLMIRVRELIVGEYGYNTWAYGQQLEDESWGIDNVHIKIKETNKKFVCSMTGVGSSSQMYCWGNIARSIPIVNTSLYDISKISTMNKLFITNENDKKTQMSFDEYYNSGKLFLKYPTYIGGFDYEFYFK